MRYTGPKWWDGQSWRPNPTLPEARIVPTSGAGSVATVTTITSIPATARNVSQDGSATFTISGSVKTAAGGNVTTGTVTLQKWNGSAWTNVATGITISGTGAWSRGSNSITATTKFRAVHVPVSPNSASTSGSKTVTCLNKTTYEKTYSPSWGASFNGSNVKRAGIDECYQGFYSSTNGNQRSAIGFPSLTADLSGATVTKVELYIYAGHWGPDSGGTAVIGYHGASAEPGSWPPSGLVADEKRVGWTTKTGGKWIDVTSIGTSIWSAGTAKGIAFGPGPDNGLEYYGYFKGPGQTYEPKLRLTYYKWV